MLSQWHVVKALTVAILSGINEKRDISMTAAGYCHGGYGVDWTIALPWYKSRIEATYWSPSSTFSSMLISFSQ